MKLTTRSVVNLPVMKKTPEAVKPNRRAKSDETAATEEDKPCDSRCCSGTGSYDNGEALTLTPQPMELDWSFLRDGKLFGRDEEIEILQNALKRRLITSSNQEQEFVLVSGRSGDGKSALTKKALEEYTTDTCHGHYLRSKFDQLQCNSREPLRPVVAALSQLAASLDPHRVKQLQTKIEASHLDLTTLCTLVPSLGRVLGIDHNAPTAKDNQHVPQEQQGSHENPHDNNNQLPVLSQDVRLEIVLPNFFRMVASPAHPVVLVMDDLQWADQRSLDLLEVLASDTEIQGLLVVGICRSNEVPFGHGFAQMLRQLEDERNTRILHIRLQGLSVSATEELLAAILLQPRDNCRLLAEKIHPKSNDGNPFFVSQLLKTLHQFKVVSMEAGEDANHWMWDEDKWEFLLSKTMELDVLHLVWYQLQSLPDECQKLLQCAASMGAELDTDLLATVLGQNTSEVVETLAVSVDQGMVETAEQQGDRSSRSQRFTFSHDRIQQAAYALIPVPEQPAKHLSIGRALLEHLLPDEVEENLFLIVNQLLAGQSLLKVEVDKWALAELCLRAGEKAMQAHDYHMARGYLQMGSSLLPPRNWRDEYHLSLALSCARAEAECCSASFDEMDKTIDDILANCRSPLDKIRPWLTMIYAFGLRSMFEEAIGLGLEVMASLGETFPSKPRLIYLIPEFMKLKLRLKRNVKRNRNGEFLLELPRMDTDDRGKMGIISILNLLMAHSFCADPDLYPFLVLRYVKLTLKYGICNMSCLAFSSYALMLCALGEHRDGYRYGELALKLWGDCPTNVQKQYLPRLFVFVHGMVSPWRTSVKDSLEPLERSISASIETNDVECAQAATYLLYINALATGLSLCDLERLMYQHFHVLQVCQTGPWLALSKLQLHFIDGLRGKLDNPWESSPGTDDVQKQDFDLYESVVCQWKCELAYHFGALDVAIDNCVSSRKNKGPPKAAFIIVHDQFFDCMTLLETAARRPKGRWSRPRVPFRGRSHIKVFKKLAESCPENVCHKYYVLKGEVAALKGDLALALSWYVKAGDEAARQGMTQFQALAYERSAVAHKRLGGGGEDNARIVTQLLQHAIELYGLWGATGIVDHLKDKHNM